MTLQDLRNDAELLEFGLMAAADPAFVERMLAALATTTPHGVSGELCQTESR